MAGKTKADQAGYVQLKKDISANTLGQLYVLHGEERYLCDHYLGRMKELLLPKGLEEFNLHTFSGNEVDVAKLSQAVDCLPMMSERTVILVTDWDIYADATRRDGLATLFGDLPPYCCLIFLYDVVVYKPDARTKLAQAVKAHGHVVNFQRQGQSDLINWIVRRFRAMDHDIDSELAGYLIFLCGDLMTNLTSEIGKIGTFAQKRPITRGDIDAVATPQLDAVVFQMTDAIGRRDFDKAAVVMSDLLHLQQAPIMLLSVLGRQIRQIYSARLALEHRQGPRYLMDLWGMSSSYPAEKLLNNARRFSLDWCRRSVALCAQSDLAMKSGQDGRDVLVGLLMALAALSQEETLC